LLIRRNRTTGELAYYRCHSTEPVPLAALVRAGFRWRVEETFQTGKGLAGLDEHQVRRYPSWARWVTLAMLAHAFLAVVRADEHAHRPGPADLVPLSCKFVGDGSVLDVGRMGVQVRVGDLAEAGDAPVLEPVGEALEVSAIGNDGAGGGPWDTREEAGAAQCSGNCTP
jgi:hypothetical protein